MKNMNHTEYPKRLKEKSTGELLFIIKDAREAMEAMPENENNSYYADEICYCGMELKSRKTKGEN